MLGQIDSEQRRRTYAALITDEPAKHPRCGAGHPRERSLKLQAPREPGQFSASSEQKQRAEQDHQRRRACPLLKERARQTTNRAHHPETPQDTPIYSAAKQPEAKCRTDEMRN